MFTYSVLVTATHMFEYMGLKDSGGISGSLPTESTVDEIKYGQMRFWAMLDLDFCHKALLGPPVLPSKITQVLLFLEQKHL